MVGGFRSSHNIDTNIKLKDSSVYLILLDEVLGTGISLLSVTDNIRKAEK